MLEQFKDKTITQHFKDGVSYQQSMGFTTKWAECDRFLNGVQWGEASTFSDKTKFLPRPVFNIISYIIRHKVASIQNESLKMVFTPEELPLDNTQVSEELMLAMQGANQFSKYSEVLWENIKQDKLNDEMLTSCANIGTGIIHFYWDSQVSGGIDHKYIGEIAGEVLDPSNVFFGNPQINDVQKQPFIVISSRELLSSVQDEAKKNGLPVQMLELLREDEDTSNEIYDTAKKEYRGVKKVNVLTEYYKKNGTVFFKKVCNEIIITPETNTGLRLYPIALMNWGLRKKCIYGLGDTEQLIPNQKSINFNLAMLILANQQIGFPKLLVKPGSLKQKVTNVPGEIITDYFVGNGQDGIKFMQSPAFNPMSITLTDKLCDLTKEFSNANESALGNSPGSDTSAAAIMLLQKSANTSLDNVKSRFHRFIEDVGKVWLEFWLSKYNIPRPITYKNSNGQLTTELLEGTQYREFPYHIKISVGSSASFSEITQQATLDKLFEMGHIDVLTYIKYSSDNNIPNKESLMNDIAQQQQMLAMQQPMGSPSMGGSELDMLMAQEEGMPIEKGNPELGIPTVKPPSLNNINRNAKDVGELLPGVR